LKNAMDTDAVDKAKQLDRNGYRLPTETEWEYAARGGVPSDAAGSAWTYAYAGTNEENALPNFAWYNVNASSTTHPVGQKAANSAGLNDMNGNVTEWCFDKSGTIFHVVRGGSWSESWESCKVANSGTYTTNYAGTNVGFRLVVSR
ncbi:MAG: formylglycine-generating enzyme family protein, partial [Spirochaetaceae bacterium]|nr:formylglycine-generating enzyme family protein [Spirochaetaceae bacterium]